MHCRIVMPKLEALLPAPMLHAYTAASPDAGLKVECASGAYLDLLSFSLGNNFAGIDGLPPQRILDYLKSQSTTHIARLMLSIGGQTGRALAEKLFTCAVEAQDASIVETILQYSQNTKVHANKSVFKYEGVCYTPIERSAGLRDIETTRVLLKYGADSNKTLMNKDTIRGSRHGWREGALSCALQWNSKDKTPVEFELVQLLLEHGAYVSTYHLEKAIEQQRSEVLHALFQAGASKNHEQWGKLGLFGQVIQVLSDEAATGSISMLKQIGADVDAPQDRIQPTMLDMTARRGNFDIVMMLLHFGAIATDTTLSYAIQGQNQGIVDLFLHGEKTNGLSCCRLRTTPYAEAIRIGDEKLMQILERKGSWNSINERDQYIAALDAASEAGNAEIIRRLLKTSPKTSPNTGRRKFSFGEMLTNALVTAVSANNDEIAIMLIHAGASVFGNLNSTAPLQKALENRNAEIVRALLNFGARHVGSLDPLLALAAKWGNVSIINDLLVSGCHINHPSNNGDTPLVVAIEKRDPQLVRFFLNAGSDVNTMLLDAKTEYRTALSTAVEIQDIDMVNYLLSVGADPDDSAALRKSCENCNEVLDLLLKAFFERYPNGKGGYFDDAIELAIKKNDMAMLESLRPVVSLKFPQYSQHVGELIGKRLISNNKVSFRAVQMLLDLGANPDAVVSLAREAERTPLLCVAIKANNAQIVQLLLDKGADVNFPATRGVKFTPIQLAAKMGYYEIVLTLINRGANVDAPATDAGGGTAVQLASIGGFVGIVELLLRKGANVNRFPSILYGRTALEGAAEWGRLDMVQFLLQSGAQIDGRGRQSFLNATKLAEQNGHFVVLELLKSYSS